MEATTKWALVVEDEDLIGLILFETLEEQGFNAIEVKAADEAVRLLNEVNGFDLVVTDIQMLGWLDSIALGHRIRHRHNKLQLCMLPASLTIWQGLHHSERGMPCPASPMGLGMYWS